MEPEPTVETSPKPKTSKKRLILAGVLLVIGFLILSAGASVLYYNQDTDSEGYAYSNVYHVNTTAYAFTAYMNEYRTSTWDWLGPENVAQIKYIVRNLNPAKELFIGYATTAQSEPYRKSFQCEIPTYWNWHVEPYYAEIYINTTVINGTGAPATLPQTQTFWLTTAQSSDTAVMTYLPQHEQHIWFIMNSDGSPHVTADIQIGFKSPILTILPLILLPLGIILLIGGVLLLRRKKDKPIKTE
jgi:hypothetical protein